MLACHLLSHTGMEPIDFATTRFIDRLMDIAAARGEAIPKRGTPAHRRLRAQLVKDCPRKVWKFKRREPGR